MGELSSFEIDRLEHVRRLVTAIYGNLVGKIIAKIKALPDSCRQSGEDSNLKDVWDEFKYQVQREQSPFFELYAQTIRDVCARQVKRLDRERQGLLWLWSEGYIDWDEEDGKIPWGDPVHEAVVEQLYQEVCSAASNEKWKVDPDEDRDRERGEEDTGLYEAEE